MTAALAPAPASAASTTTTVPLQSPHGGEFESPSGNISCELDFHERGVPNQTYCQTVSPPKSVTMSATGTLKTCSGMVCIGNPALNVITLPYGSSTGVGPFRCLSSTSGVTCTTSGKGFEISRAGIYACTSKSSAHGTLTSCPTRLVPGRR
jgi:hypothetical protein